MRQHLTKSHLKSTDDCMPESKLCPNPSYLVAIEIFWTVGECMVTVKSSLWLKHTTVTIDGLLSSCQICMLQISHVFDTNFNFNFNLFINQLGL